MLSLPLESNRNPIRLRISLQFHVWQSLPGGQLGRKYAITILSSKILLSFSVIPAGRPIAAHGLASTIGFVRAVDRKGVGVITMNVNALRLKIKRKKYLRQRLTLLSVSPN